MVCMCVVYNAASTVQHSVEHTMHSLQTGHPTKCTKEQSANNQHLN